MTDHAAEARKSLVFADELFGEADNGGALTAATMAQAHATLALVEAQRGRTTSPVHKPASRWASSGSA